MIEKYNITGPWANACLPCPTDNQDLRKSACLSKKVAIIMQLTYYMMILRLKFVVKRN